MCVCVCVCFWKHRTKYRTELGYVCGTHKSRVPVVRTCMYIVPKTGLQIAPIHDTCVASFRPSDVFFFLNLHCRPTDPGYYDKPTYMYVCAHNSKTTASYLYMDFGFVTPAPPSFRPRIQIDKKTARTDVNHEPGQLLPLPHLVLDSPQVPRPSHFA